MIELVSALKRASRGEVLRDVPLAPRTSVRVGGPARLWVKPQGPPALVEVLRVLSGASVGWISLGGGANTIVGDRGVDGAVLRLAQDFAIEEVEEAGDHVVVTLGAGAPIASTGCSGSAFRAAWPVDAPHAAAARARTTERATTLMLRVFRIQPSMRTA